MEEKQDPFICCLQETHFRSRDTYRLKVREQNKVFCSDGSQKKAGVAIFISNKILSNKDYYKRQIKILHNDQQIGEEDLSIVNIYSPNIGAIQHTITS